MSIVEILSPERVSVSNPAEGMVSDKSSALERLARMLASGQEKVDAELILRVLTERERLQSTGVGGGVAVPHGSVAELQSQIGALLVCPRPIDFDAIDGAPVNILFALVGPKGAPAEHLKILARVSRLLREAAFRERLAQAQSGSEAYRLISSSERGAV
ncbi:MAG TPA: PTS sugar transporter subunit IIA [Polyangiaceae bacterium]|nr:PTS sugar transporter subunit IIA [Polyangiaceae bacterium]